MTSRFSRRPTYLHLRRQHHEPATTSPWNLGLDASSLTALSGAWDPCIGRNFYEAIPHCDGFPTQPPPRHQPLDWPPSTTVRHHAQRALQLRRGCCPYAPTAISPASLPLRHSILTVPSYPGRAAEETDPDGTTSNNPHSPMDAADTLVNRRRCFGEGDIRIMGNLYPPHAHDNCSLYKLLPANQEGYCYPRDGRIHLCRCAIPSPRTGAYPRTE